MAGVQTHLDNKAAARFLNETADLMEIDNQDSFRVRSYRRAAEAIDALPLQLSEIVDDTKQLLEIPGIGKSMATHLQQIYRSGKLDLHSELLKKYGPSILELLKIQGLGPKTIALLWSAHRINDVEGVEKLARAGKLRELPRMGEKQEQKILKAIEDYRRISGRFLIDAAEEAGQKLAAYLAEIPGVEKVTPAGSLRRGRETVGDLDMLITGKACTVPKQRDAIIEKITAYPHLQEVMASGENKVSFRLRNGMQVDVRLLPPDSFGAAMLYFTGSKSHNIILRQRALKMGYTLNEYALARLKDEKRVAGKTEEEIYGKLGLDYIPPEMREALGEIEAAEKHELPHLVELKDIRGDVHMHTVATDGKNTIEEMAEAARARGYQYIAITDHSKNLAMANGLDDKRALEHIRKIRAAAKKTEGLRILAGIEVDILADGQLDLSDPVLAEMDVVIASVHSHFSQEPAQMTERLRRAVANPNTDVLGHPTGRLLLRRDAYKFDLEAVLKDAAKAGVAMELNSFPDRLDLCDTHLRLAKQHGVRIVINTDSHHTSHLEKMRYGILQARRAWLTKADILNTLPAEKFLPALQRA
ncbi:MAG TPA: DNA polymerase/3'-5' exonuclease PolX [Terriglobales bacterium]|nr:DNA polymerase/3'-5' exonuclease PolX [Terriglobales bacterium]